jgi:hypothetical protein
VIQQSRSLKYEPSSEPLHISVQQSVTTLAGALADNLRLLLLYSRYRSYVQKVLEPEIQESMSLRYEPASVTTTPRWWQIMEYNNLVLFENQSASQIEAWLLWRVIFFSITLKPRAE